MTFVRRKIKLSITGENVGGLTEENLRVSVRITGAGGVSMGAADILVYGLTLSTMNQLSTFGRRISFTPRRTITVEAGDAVNGMSMVYQGPIIQAWPDFQGAPLVPFHIVSQNGSIDMGKPIDPISFSGSTDAGEAAKRVAKQMDEVKSFENHGVNTKIDSPYLWGSPRNMMKQLASTAKFAWVLENGVLAIWPADKARGGGGLLISPETGMVSYPAFTELGVLTRSEFRRAVQFGTTFTVKSDIQPACGDWQIVRIEYDLESDVPHGHWFMTLEGTQLQQGGKGPVVGPM